MSGHTKGPWEACGHLIRTARTADDRRGIGIGEAFVTNPNRADDARLMAASTDLLEAAKAAWNCIGELPPTQARVEVAQMLHAVIEKADPEWTA